MKNQVLNQEENKRAMDLLDAYVQKINDGIYIIINEGSNSDGSAKKEEIVLLTRRSNQTSIVKEVKVSKLKKSVKYIKRAVGEFSLKKRTPYQLRYETIAIGPEDAYICSECRGPVSLLIGSLCFSCNDVYAEPEPDDNDELNNPYANVDIKDDELPF